VTFDEGVVKDDLNRNSRLTNERQPQDMKTVTDLCDDRSGRKEPLAYLMVVFFPRETQSVLMELRTWRWNFMRDNGDAENLTMKSNTSRGTEINLLQWWIADLYAARTERSHDTSSLKNCMTNFRCDQFRK
jgi:hypothetical protein